MTESAKTGLICTKYTYSVIHAISVNFIEFLRKFCVYDEMFDQVASSTKLGKRVIKFERLKIRSNLTCR